MPSVKIDSVEKKLLESLKKAKGTTTWLDLLVDGARARGYHIEYEKPRVGRPRFPPSENPNIEKHREKYREYGRKYYERRVRRLNSTVKIDG